MLRATLARTLCLTVALAVAGAAPAQEEQTWEQLWTRLQAMPVAAPAGTGIAVEVVDADGKPCPTALLTALDATKAESMRVPGEALRRIYGQDQRRLMAAAMLAFGTRHGLDERGHARVPGDERLSLVAFTATAVAMGRGTKTAGKPVQLRLQALRRRAVQVLDADGKPAVGLTVAIAPAGSMNRSSAARTGDDGKATVPEPLLPADDGRQRVVTALAALQRRLEVPLPDDPGAPVTVQLPPCARLRVVLAHADDATDPPPQVRLLAGERDRTGFQPTAADAHGAVFAFVEPGPGWQVEVARGPGFEPLRVPVPALTVGQEARLEIDLALAKQQQRLQFRVLDRAGQPLAGATLVARWQRQGSSSSTTPETDGEGRLELPVPDGFAADGTLLLSQPIGDRSRDAHLAFAEVPLADLTPGLNRRADVRLQEPPLLLAGQVVDADGKPLAGVEVSAADDRGSEQLAAPSDAQGRFVVRGLPPLPASVRPGVGGDWYLQPTEAAGNQPAGSTDLRLTVTRYARLLLRSRPLPDGVSGSLQVVCHRHGGEDDAVPFSVSLSPQQKQLRVPPGVWDLAFHIDRRGEELHRLDKVTADAGVENHDPRLLDFDWSAFTTVVTVQVTGPDGKPCDDVTVWHYTKHQGGRSGSGYRPRDGTVRILVPKAGAELTVQPNEPSLRPVELGVVTGDTKVQLQPAPRLRVRLQPPPQLPAGVALELWISGAAPTRQGASTVDAAGNGEVHAPRTGRQTLRLRVRKGSVSQNVENVTLPVEIGEQPGEVVFPLDEAKLAAIVAAAQGF